MGLLLPFCPIEIAALAINHAYCNPGGVVAGLEKR